MQFFKCSEFLPTTERALYNEAQFWFFSFELEFSVQVFICTFWWQAYAKTFHVNILIMCKTQQKRQKPFLKRQKSVTQYSLILRNIFIDNYQFSDTIRDTCSGILTSVTMAKCHCLLPVVLIHFIVTFTVTSNVDTAYLVPICISFFYISLSITS